MLAATWASTWLTRMATCEIQITDDGPGVESSIRDKMFQPFVSFGKENGTGLGLTIAQKIVQDHNGSLQLESSTQGQTVMQIILPRVSRKTAAGNEQLPAKPKLFPPDFYVTTATSEGLRNR